MRQQVRRLVAKGALQMLHGEFSQAGVQFDSMPADVRHAGGCAQAAVPDHAHLFSERGRPGAAQQDLHLFQQGLLVRQRSLPGGGSEAELSLLPSVCGSWLAGGLLR